MSLVEWLMLRYFRLAAWFGGRRLFKAWVRSAPSELPRHWTDVEGFEQRLRERWRNGLDGLEFLWLQVHREGSRFNKRHRPQAATENDHLFEALTRSHARACRVGSEVIGLLRTGHPEGAHARWRTLHEIAVTMFLLKAHDHALAEAYLLHHGVVAYRSARQYQRYCSELGYEPFSAKEMDEMKNLHDALVTQYGKPYAGDYGWAASALRKDRPTFRDIEESVDMDRWRPWYRMASEGQHAGSRALVVTLGLSDDEADLLLAGPSNAGFSDPGINTAISLGQATVALLTHRPSVEALVLARALMRLVREVESDFNEEATALAKDEARRQRQGLPLRMGGSVDAT